MTTSALRLPLAIVALFLSASAVFAVQDQTDPPKPFTGKVVKVADEDTITVLVDDVQHRIRLAGIDAPESKQAFGTKAKKILADKVFGKEVKVVWRTRDRYKRIIGDIYLGDCWLNLEMVEEGYAWHYVYFSKDRRLAKAEKEAKDNKRGLWVDPDPTPPWEFRKMKKRAAGP
jgi:endonuclease YncB( thermonuclease family)